MENSSENFRYLLNSIIMLCIVKDISYKDIISEDLHLLMHIYTKISDDNLNVKVFKELNPAFIYYHFNSQIDLVNDNDVHLQIYLNEFI